MQLSCCTIDTQEKKIWYCETLENLGCLPGDKYKAAAGTA